MDNVPEAALQGTEATNTNNNSSTSIEVEAAQTTPAPLTSEQVAGYFGTSAEKIDAFNRFMEANGKFDKAFDKMKQTISNPQPQAQIQQPEPLNDSITQTQPIMAQEMQPMRPAQGYLTTNDIAALQYNRMLTEAYPELDAKYMANGEYIREAASLGIPIMDTYGNMNDGAIRKFLDLKRQTIPPTPVSTPLTTTPTVEYSMIEGEIMNPSQAQEIMSQGDAHPQYAQAVQFMKESIFGKPAEKK